MQERVINSPWRHVLLENVFSDVEFEKICSEVVPLCQDYPDGEHVLYLYDAVKAGKISKEVSDIVVNMVDSLLVQKAHELLDQFDNVVKSDNGYFCVPQFNITKNFSHGSHCDEVIKGYKTLTFLVYLSPNQSTGTLIYSDESTYHSEVPWKPNSGVYFCPYPDDTWHAFKSDGEVRITLNLNLKRIEAFPTDIESLEQAKHFAPNMFYWLMDYVKQGKLFNTRLDLKSLLPK
jgi:hypothetical protein